MPAVAGHVFKSGTRREDRCSCCARLGAHPLHFSIGTRLSLKQHQHPTPVSTRLLDAWRRLLRLRLAAFALGQGKRLDQLSHDESG